MSAPEWTLEKWVDFWIMLSPYALVYGGLIFLLLLSVRSRKE